jgi:isoleucyl-tRNA synthetase
VQLGGDLGSAPASPLLPELKVRIERALGGKCERCWNYSEAVGRDAAHPGLCDRCLPVVTAAA